MFFVERKAILREDIGLHYNLLYFYEPVTALVPFCSEGRIPLQSFRARRPSMNSLDSVSVLLDATKRTDMGETQIRGPTNAEETNAFSIGQTADRDRLFDVNGNTPGCHAGCSAGRNDRSAARD